MAGHVWSTAGTIRLQGKALRKFPGVIHDRWRDAAAEKGFGILCRVLDRYHLLLECFVCRGRKVTKLYTLTTAQPECDRCKTANIRTAARTAGLRFLHLDPVDGHYSHYLVRSCGHEVRRQTGLVLRAARGRTGLRCAICLADKEQAEAQSLGWQLIGPDPEGQAGYRLYRHLECGHEQRIARANLQTARFRCEACGGVWSGEASFIYLMKFELPSGGVVLKLGFSRNPVSRLRFQLCRQPIPGSALLRVVPMETGRQALVAEQAIHAELRREFPQSVVPPERYAPWIRVRSEVYTNAIELAVHEMLDAIAGAEALSSS